MQAPKNVLLVGNGKVGSALATIISKHHNLSVMDAEASAAAGGHYDVMHVCFPWTPTFEREVTEYIHKFNPDLTIIESTVKPYTTRNIWLRGNPERLIVHSPVRGCHSSLLWGLQTYTKFVGGTTLRSGLIAKNYYESMGMKVHLAKGSVETEIAKLLNLSYFAAQVAFFQEVERKASEHAINHEDIIQFFLSTTRDSKGEVQRPIFKGNVIGGTCVMQGLAKLFNENEPFRMWIENSNGWVKEFADRTTERSPQIQP